MLAHLFANYHYQLKQKEQQKKADFYHELAKTSTDYLDYSRRSHALNYIGTFLYYYFDFSNVDSLDSRQLIAYLLTEFCEAKPSDPFPFILNERQKELINRIPVNVESMEQSLLSYTGIPKEDSILSEVNRTKVIHRLSTVFAHSGVILWGMKAIASQKDPIEVYEGDTLEMQVDLIYDSYREGTLYKMLPSPNITPLFHDEGVLRLPIPKLKNEGPKFIKKSFDIPVLDIITGDTSMWKKVLNLELKVLPRVKD